VDILWVGAAPGNAGGRGSGALGAHGTRIPFGGDVAGANLEVLLGSIGINRNETFITAALNSLPERGGGEPTLAEILAPQGGYANSIHVVRDTIVASGPRLIVCLGNVAARICVAAMQCPDSARLPALAALNRAGWARGGLVSLEESPFVSATFRTEWQIAWNRPLPALLWLMHPSAQNMSPFARTETLFHTRMVEAVAALRAAAKCVLSTRLPGKRPSPPDTGIYGLPEWRERIAPRNAALDKLWRQKGV
jgi:uracil-DNA glycosylase family 4